ncbi:OmpA family protein [Pedobacter punctiformis]|uniref:OmpA family protein n=1 Tax=Pedobacter punctiformis TaxID=3004097 RepID=A0ABT4LCR5_9SPHI|nr:OmpA family protein [Pedobacter sp. HCMS5-2]MCZ4245715.1 OmpA family protein [Pedobacter sp. HCMS5-2]
MKKIYTIILNKTGLFLLTLLLASTIAVKAQYVIKEADIQYELFNYVKAIDLYEQAWAKKESLHTAERLASSYQLTQNYKEAESWYAIASKMPGSSAENTLNYAKALQNNGKYSEAKTQYQNYVALNNAVSLEQQNVWYLSCDSAIKWMRNPKKYTIQNEKGLNSSQSDWAAVNYQGGVVFTSDRAHQSDAGNANGSRPFLKFDGSKVPDPKIYGWTGNGYLRLYFKGKDQDSISLFPINADTRYHIGSASFSQDGKEVYFTLTRIPEKSELTNGKLRTINVELYSSKQDAAGKWSDPVAFAYNNVKEYSVGDPFLSPKGDALYFSSNMAGGLGGTDLYVCFRKDGGDWDKPVNLKDVNTPGNERSPAFDQDNNMYFSSDGRIGMGGLDIYKAKLSGSTIGAIENLGYPANSAQDDFAFNMNNAVESGKAYLSSNRTGGSGSDDIYSFIQQKIMALRLEGVVYNKKTNEPIANAQVTLNKIDGSTLKVETDNDGKFKFNLEENSDYDLRGDKTAYLSDKTNLTTRNLNTSTVIKKDLFLDPIVPNQAIRLENIYYDFDKSNIRPDAAIELDKLVKILQDNPTIWIELGSHTDSRGNDQYNQWLSQSRANSAVQYIIDHGISKNRITAKGYGESQLLNRCANGVKCTEAEHQLNRRTEFKIVKQ